MTFNLNFLSSHRSNTVLNVFAETRLWSCSAEEGVFSARRGWLRRFLLLKMITVLLFPHGTELPLLVGCLSSLQALLLLRSPRISTKPFTVFLGQLALADGLLLLRWMLWLFATLGPEAEAGLVKEGKCALCQQILDAHQLSCLLVLGLLGLEASLASADPQL
ncbi:hypothetical protein LDENG_00157900 [Lucifuga dentata]|nr:hypothetical protein LDENG_00157900 [Lucifuga dentata]